MEDIGKKIRQLRLDNHWALKELASRTGLTSSFLSQLEKGTTSPSVESLRKIAAALGTTVGALFKKDESRELVFIRRQRPKTMVGQCEVLAAQVLDVNMLPVMVRLGPGESVAAADCPQAQEMLGVPICGRITVCVNDKEFPLQFGDSIYLIAPRFQAIKNGAEQESLIVWTMLRTER